MRERRPRPTGRRPPPGPAARAESSAFDSIDGALRDRRAAGGPRSAGRGPRSGRRLPRPARRAAAEGAARAGTAPDRARLAGRRPRAGRARSTRRNTSRRSAWSARSTSRPATSRRPGPITASSARTSRSPGRSSTTGPTGTEGDGERLGAVIEVAFNHGVNPRRGFELILEHYGTCSAISAFEGLPATTRPVRIACAERLIRHLHGELSANLRADIAGRGQLLPPAGATRSPS